MGTTQTKLQNARASVRQARAQQLVQAAEREARIEEAGAAAVLAWQTRQQAAQRLAKADEHVAAQLKRMASERLTISQVAALTGISARICRTLLHDPGKKPLGHSEGPITAGSTSQGCSSASQAEDQ